MLFLSVGHWCIPKCLHSMQLQWGLPGETSLARDQDWKPSALQTVPGAYSRRNISGMPKAWYAIDIGGNPLTAALEDDRRGCDHLLSHARNFAKIRSLIHRSAWFVASFSIRSTIRLFVNPALSSADMCIDPNDRSMIRLDPGVSHIVGSMISLDPRAKF